MDGGATYSALGTAQCTALPDINTLRSLFGLQPVNNYAKLLYDTPEFSLALFPEWFGATMPDWPRNVMRGDFLLFDSYAGQPLSDELQEFLAAGDPPVVFTFGSAMKQAGAIFEESLHACARLQRRGIFLSMFGEQIPDNLPPTVKWLPYVPFRDLLPFVAAVVHTGGVGSMAETMRAGIPQIIVPMVNDQFDNCARVEALGIGIGIAHHRYRAATVTKALTRLLSNDSVRANCRTVAACFQDPHPAQTVCNSVIKCWSENRCT